MIVFSLDCLLASITKIITFFRILCCNSLFNSLHYFTVFINALYTVNISIFSVITDCLFFLSHFLSPFI